MSVISQHICCLTAAVLLSGVPLLGAAARPSATIPDTLDWRGYYPLAVGNAWEYNFDNFPGPPMFYRWEIERDTLIDGIQHFVQRRRTFDEKHAPMGDDRLLLYYDDESHTVRTLRGALSSECSFAAAFPKTREEYAPLECGDNGMWVQFSGGYTHDSLRIGTDYAHYGAFKAFAYQGPVETFFHGIGIPGWVSEGVPAQAWLIYLRIDGAEYGESVVVTAREPEPQVPPSRPMLDLYPSPFSDRLTLRIDAPPAGPLRYEIVDMLGRRVLTGTAETTRENLPADKLTPGVYFVRIWSGSDLVETRSVVKVSD